MDDPEKIHAAIEEMRAEMLQKIRDRDQRTLTSIYKEVYPMVEKYILKNSGSSDDAKDVFQDAMFLLIKKVADVNFELSSKLSTYLVAVSKNLWLKRLTRKKIDLNDLKYEEDFQNEEEIPDFEGLDRSKKMHWGLEKIGEPCKSLLEQFYFYKASMEEIATAFNYTNAGNAKNQKYKCLQRLKKLIGRG